MASAPDVVVSGNLRVSDFAQRRERIFFTSMAVAMALACFAGFAPSYYLKSYFGTSPLAPLVHLHGALFSAWILLLVAQTSLIAGSRVQLHRQLGIAGGALAIGLVVSGAALVWGRATTPTPAMPHDMILRFLALSTTALFAFPTLIALALRFRRDAATHKRLMMLATTVMVGAAVHRLMMQLFGFEVGPLVFFGATDLFVVALIVFDRISRGRIHPATLWGGLAVIVSQVVGLTLAGSDAWLAFAKSVTGM